MKKLIKFLILTILLGIITLIGLYITAYALGEPQIEQNRYVKMYDNNEDVFYETNANYSGQYADINNVSTYFLDAIVAIEDHRFYSHYGFDFIAIGRAVFTNILNGEKSQGASTISQQYARLLYLNNDKTWSRKIKEAFLTMQLETRLNKDEVLEGYINQVYFGHGIYGIENASYYYFAKSASDLDLNEATILAGVVNGPSYYSPLINMESAKERQSLVLSRMVDLSFISTDIANTTSQLTLQLANENQSLDKIQYFYFRDTVYDELDTLGFNTDTYLNRGLNIYTTLSTLHQDELITSIENNTDNSGIQNASVIVEPYTSKILALMGGNDYGESQFNRATDASRHIGSTIKPLLYYQALLNGFDVTTKFLSEPTTFQLDNGSTYSPSNYDDTYANEEITLAQAMAVSDNIYAMKTHLFLGTNVLSDFLIELGFQNVSPNASLALGTIDTNVMQLANAYNIIASEGLYQPIYTIQSIVDDYGTILYQRDQESMQLLDQDTCLILSQLMTSPFDTQFTTYLGSTLSLVNLQNINAGKTGSTDVDALSVGFNPNILIVNWAGYDNNDHLILYNDRMLAKNILVDMLTFSYFNDELIWYKPTENIAEIAINPLTGELDENGTIYWFKQ